MNRMKIIYWIEIEAILIIFHPAVNVKGLKNLKKSNGKLNETYFKK